MKNMIIICFIIIIGLGVNAIEIQTKRCSVQATKTGIVFCDDQGTPAFELGGLVSGGRKLPIGEIEQVEKTDDSPLLITYRFDKKEKNLESLQAVCRLTDNGIDLRYELKMKDPKKFRNDLFLSLKPMDHVTFAFQRRVPYQTLFDASNVVDKHCGMEVRNYITPTGEVAIVRCGKVWSKHPDFEDLVFVHQPDGRYFANICIRVPKRFAPPKEPLRHVSNYSLYIDKDLKSGDELFPLGILGLDTDFSYTAYMGGNYVPIGFHVNSAQSFNNGEKCFYQLPENPVGVYNLGFPACRITRAWKPAKLRLDNNGKPVWGVSFFDDKTRDQIYLNAARAVKHVTSLPNQSSVLGWGIDNEYVPPFDYSLPAKMKFIEWLKESYNGKLKKLNTAWNTNYRSFESAEPPQPDEYNKKIAAWLDWTRFQQEGFAEFLGGYYAAMYQADPIKRRVTGKDTQTSLEMQTISRYRAGNHELIGLAIKPYSNGLRGMDHYGHGDRHAYEMNYYYNTIAPIGLKPGRRVGMVYGESNNHNGPAWQFDQTFYRMIPNGWRGGNFFCTGWFGSRGDWASFSFINPDGTLRDKFFSVVRLNATIHRAEKLFAQGAVPQDLPKLAILLPQRDVPLGVDYKRNPWEYAINSRLAVFQSLRQAGYWVQVITYDKLRPEYMKDVQGLFLVAAEHLTDTDLERIRDYVKKGGKLFADTRCGMYDEHHLPHKVGLSDVLGVEYIDQHKKTEVDPGDCWFSSRRGNIIRADGRINASLTTAKTLNNRHAFHTSNKAACLTMNKYGKGEAYWVNTQFGTLRSESSLTNLPVVEWYSELLKYAGLRPNYTVHPGNVAAMRCEMPLMDDKGNTVLILTDATYEPMPAGCLTVTLPKESKFQHAFMSLAESTELKEIKYRKEADGKYSFFLPEYKSAVVIWLLHDHPPLLGFQVEGVKGHAENDIHTPKVSPGDSFKVRVTLTNASEKALPAGEVKLRALMDWEVSPSQQKTEALGPGKSAEFVFEVKLPDKSEAFIPNFIYPLLAEFFTGGIRTALYHGVVNVNVPLEGRELLLSDNWSDGNYPWAIWTGAEYQYLTKPKENQEIKDSICAYTGDRAPIYALQSGDRRGCRKHASYKNLSEVEILFDLKSRYDVSRLLVRRGNRYATETPNQIIVTCSKDGKAFSKPMSFTPKWEGEIAELKLTAPEDSRYVKIRFEFPNQYGCLDEVWIFGKLIPGQPVGKIWGTYPERKQQ